MFQQCSNLRTIDRRSVTDYLHTHPTHAHAHTLSLVEDHRGGSPATYIRTHSRDDVVRTPLFDRVAATFFMSRYANQVQELRHPDLVGENTPVVAHTSPPSSLSSKSSPGTIVEEHPDAVEQPDPTPIGNNDNSVTLPYHPLANLNDEGDTEPADKGCADSSREMQDSSGENQDSSGEMQDSSTVKQDISREIEGSSRENQATILRALAVSDGLRRETRQLRHLTLRLGFSLLRTAAHHARVRLTWEGRTKAAMETERIASDAMERERSVFEKRMLQEKQRYVLYICMYVCIPNRYR